MSITGSPTSWLKTLASLLAGLLMLHMLALSIHDAVLDRKAMNRLENIEQAGTPYIWDLSRPTAVQEYEQYGLEALSFDAEGMHLTAANDAPYFWLKSAGMGIDATRYSVFEADIYSSVANRLSFVFANDHSGEKTLFQNLIYSDSVDLDEGWQTVVVDMNMLTWRLASEPGDITRWGGESGLVSNLRINPGNIAGEQLIIRSVRLLNPERNDPGRPPEWFPVTMGDDLSSLERAVTPYLNDTVILFDASRIRTVESSRLLRERVAREIPGAVLFPDIKRAVSAEKVPDSYPPTLTFSPLWAQIVCYVLMVILVLGMSVVMKADSELRARFFRHRYFPLFSLLYFIVTVWSLVSIAVNLWLVVSVFLVLTGFILVLMYYRRVENHCSWVQECGLVRADSRLWVTSFVMIAVMVAVILGLATWFDTFEQVETDVLLTNLWQYPLWGLVQQILLGPVLGRELFRMLGGSEQDAGALPDKRLWLASLLAGLIFGLIHTPNFSLMAATFPLGFLWCWLYLRYRSIIPLAIAHAVLATLFRELAPDFLRLDGEVTMTYYYWLWQ